MKLPLIAYALALAAAPASAKVPALHVEGWARAAATNSAAYLAIHNGGRNGDRLIGASSPAANNVSIHDSQSVGGVVRMRAAGPLPIAAGGRLTMKPGGLHVMLMGLKAPLRVGARLPLTLRFEKAGLVRTSLPVLAPGSQGPAGEAHHGH